MDMVHRSALPIALSLLSSAMSSSLATSPRIETIQRTRRSVELVPVR
jgi:hypothetical protein